MRARFDRMKSSPIWRRYRTMHCDPVLENVTGTAVPASCLLRGNSRAGCNCKKMEDNGQRRPCPHEVSITLGCEKRGNSIDVRGELRKEKKKKEGREGRLEDLKRKEGICDDTYRVKKHGARRELMSRGSTAEAVLRGFCASATAGALGARWGGVSVGERSEVGG